MLCESKIRSEEDGLLKMFLHLPELLVQVSFRVTYRWWICDEFSGYWPMMPIKEVFSILSPASREKAR
ncbi:hypothetical protein T02_13036 [Trichinella nativa]|uniref:Uncharacterized protein n=1 Tax=Trichinella nativa TaxID=6335 RepID=A0A0V1LFA0_9BILA|nr:hypothetical protein T02_13036 [Trichinella nativa]